MKTRRCPTKLLVCIKQVCETETSFLIDETGRWIRLEEPSAFRMNRPDEYAVEEAVRISETIADSSIEVISVGPARVSAAIRRALGMGAAHGIHIVTPEDGYLSPFVTASWIASFARNREYDLILTGVMSEDEMQGQVGSMIAELLGMPCATSTVSERLLPETGTVRVEREIEGGLRDALELRLPAVLTIQTGINEPRYPSLSKLLRANKYELETIDSRSIGDPEPPEQVIRVSYPEHTRAGLVLNGTGQEKAAHLLRILRERSLIQ
ncbi:MAG: electron transfer flavoprotein subunit beta/FixA family protein [Deltaproteobacteria bacterium]